ncbi:MAG: F0F1 ATP synthase subunit gamma [Oscillospiraceae bacterium]|nr:F0F1 ATP synthase subunit gamma [Oscillospiraceae bacterium]
MPSKKIIKRRITSVKATKQIMKAMDMVATTKLQKVKSRVELARPLFGAAGDIIENLKRCDEASDNVFVKPREVKGTAYLVLSGDRGLCGSYNNNIVEKAMSHMRERDNEQIIAIGTKGRDALRRRGKNVLSSHTDISQKMNYLAFMYSMESIENAVSNVDKILSGPSVAETALYRDAELVSGMLIDLFKSGKVDEVYIVYTHFESVLSYRPTLAKVLPLGEKDAGPGKDMHYEQDVDEFFEHATPLYLSAFVYSAMLESACCEFAARMTSMNSATKNAGEIIDKLTLVYNRRRQADITQEINEIVGGASVTKG